MNFLWSLKWNSGALTMGCGLLWENVLLGFNLDFNFLLRGRWGVTWEDWTTVATILRFILYKDPWSTLHTSWVREAAIGAFDGHGASRG